MYKYLTANTVTEMICLLVSVIFLLKDRSAYWRLFMSYLFIVCITETGGIYLRNIRVHNYGIYAVFLLFECSMISTFFYYIYRKYHHRISMFSIWAGVFLVAYLTELFLSNFKAFPYQTATFMSVVFVIASLYFYLLILRDEKFRKLGTYPPFWITNGILFYYFGSTACNVFFDYLIQHDHSHAPNLSVRYIIFNVLNVLLYGCWSYAFICRYYQRKLSF